MLCKCILSLTHMMVLLTETVLFYWDFLDDLYQQSTKGNISSVNIRDWADKINTTKPVHTLIAQHSQGCGQGSQRGRTVSGTTNSRLKSNKGTPASTTFNTHVSAAHSNPSLNINTSNASISYIGSLNEEDLQPPPSTQSQSHHKQAMASFQNDYHIHG